MVIIIFIRKQWCFPVEKVFSKRLITEVEGLEARIESKRDNEVLRRSLNLTAIFGDYSSYSEKKTGRKTEIGEKYPKTVETQTQRDKEFLQNWCRIQNARTNWQSLLMPCINNTVWGENNSKHVKKTDGAKSFISHWDLQPAGRFSRFFIQSVSRVNEKKTLGGDSWRVHLRGPAVVVPTVFDLNNGVYEVLFLMIEPGRYRTEMYLDYTLCNGFKDPPPYWFKSGKI